MRSRLLALSLAAGVLSGCSANPDAISYQIQLVRGTDAPAAPVPGGHPIGPQLARRFQAVFKWKNYSEIASQQVRVHLGQRERVRFEQGREVELDLTNPAQRIVVAFQNGRVIDRTSCPRGPAMTLIGRDRDGANAWFVVVRPAEAQP